MKISIKIKFSIFLGVLLLSTVIILSILVLNGINNNQKMKYEEYLGSQAKIANIYIKQTYNHEVEKEPSAFLIRNAKEITKQLDSMLGMNVAIYDMEGTEIGNSLPLVKERDVKEILSYALKGNIAYQALQNTIEYMAPIYIANEQMGVIEFKYSIEKNIKFYNDIKNLFISIGSVVFIFSFIGGYFYFNKFTEIILKLKKDAFNVKNGHYRNIIPLQRNDEIGDLSLGIYYMSNQIEKNIKEMEEEQKKLRLAVKKLKTLEKQQKNFIGNITHEFKTPLTVIKAYMDLLDMYSDDLDLLKEAKVNISKETSRLYDMVEKILHLASLEKYDFEVQVDKIDIKNVLEEACNTMKGKAQKFNITLIENLKCGFILGDKESLMHIFINLIDNAIKYNEVNGKIFVSSYVKESTVFIEITDTGIGIPKEARDKIFEPFYIVNKDRSREYGGTGLGLSLVKELVEKQNGVISLLDKEIKGTSFLISFPTYNE